MLTYPRRQSFHVSHCNVTNTPCMHTDKVAAIVASLEAEGLLRYPRHRHWFFSWVYESSLLQLVALKFQLAFCRQLKTHREELETPDGGMTSSVHHINAITHIHPRSSSTVCYPSTSTITSCIHTHEYPTHTYIHTYKHTCIHMHNSTKS